MKKFRQLQTRLAVLLGAVFALGLVSGAQRAEIFPFASWFLFSLVPQDVTAYELRVSAWGDRKFDPPRSIIDIDGAVQSPRSTTVRDLIQRIGRAHESPTGFADRETAWKLLEQRLTLPPSFALECVRLRYDPLERWKRGDAALEREVVMSIRQEIATPPPAPGR